MMIVSAESDQLQQQRPEQHEHDPPQHPPEQHAQEPAPQSAAAAPAPLAIITIDISWIISINMTVSIRRLCSELDRCARPLTRPAAGRPDTPCA